jgi:hypothetical protein
MGLQCVTEGDVFDRTLVSYFDANCLRFSDTRAYAGFVGKSNSNCETVLQGSSSLSLSKS